MSKTLPLQQQYLETMVPELKKEFGTKSTMAIPKITKVVVNVGVGGFKDDKKRVQKIAEDLAMMTGQKAIINLSKKAISNFKLRENQPVGIQTTLRGENMYHFVNKLINVIFPRIRDFQGFNPKSMDGNGNLSVGVKEHTIFPEVEEVDASQIYGLQITIHTSAKDNEAGLALLKKMNFPFKK